jgi:uncharacterized protein (DUF952 family)
MPRILGKSVRVVEHDGLTIDEFLGNVASNDDSLSLAHVQITEVTSEPWLTLDYEEWLCVLQGQIDMECPDGSICTVLAGETAFLDRGESFRPSFPVVPTVYIPLCRPAFSPSRCIRREGEEPSDVTLRLQQLHSKEATKSDDPTNALVDEETITEDSKIIYHMCLKTRWDEAQNSKTAYYPPTFQEDGMFTHATAVPERLIVTANHFYTSSVGDWICVGLNRLELKKIGIQTIFEEAKPVGTTTTADSFDTWVCPHIYGGIPAHLPRIVTSIYPMIRDANGTFLSIEGL